MTKILLIDDSTKQLETYTSILAGYRVEATGASNLNQAATLFSENNGEFDAIVLDSAVNRTNTRPFVQQVRDKGFTGLIIAATNSTAQRQRLLNDPLLTTVVLKDIAMAVTLAHLGIPTLPS